MSDDPLSACQTCEAPVARVFHPVAVHFKGSGFYNTDYGTRKRAREKAESSSSESSTKSESSSSDSKASDTTTAAASSD
jgi:predicted nucleic acid-binding Zn ribbon protein